MKLSDKVIEIICSAIEYKNSRCAVCDRILFFNKGSLCERCEEKLEYVGNRCIKCLKKKENTAFPLCGDCSLEGYFFDGGVSAVTYNEIAERVVWDFKFRNNPKAAEYAAEIIEDVLSKTLWIKDIDTVTCVPSTKAKMNIRGYNQAQIISDAIGKKYGIINNNNLLYADAAIKDQIGLTGEDRFINAESCYHACEDAYKDVKGKRILICDDVFTTGATLSACAKQLKRSGAERVYFAVFAAATNRKREVKKHETSD